MYNDRLNALNSIYSLSRECSDMRNDGYTQFDAKKCLYEIKWAVDAALKKSPTFTIEDEWLRQQEQAEIINILKTKDYT